MIRIFLIVGVLILLPIFAIGCEGVGTYSMYPDGYTYRYDSPGYSDYDYYGYPYYWGYPYGGINFGFYDVDRHHEGIRHGGEFRGGGHVTGHSAGHVGGHVGGSVGGHHR